MLPPSRLAIVLSLLAAVLVACGGTTTTGTPMASPSATPATPESDLATPSASPSVPETDAPAHGPSPSAPADAPTPAIAVDSVVRTTVSGLRLREEPTTSAASLGTLANGAPSYVVDGPVAADGYSWYLLSGMGIPQYSGCSGPIPTDPWECPVWFGWAAAGPEEDAWLAEAEANCQPWPEIVNFDIILGVPRIAYLACFGDEERSLTGYYPMIPDDAGLGGACAGVPDGLSWIACNLGYEHLNPREVDPFGSGFVFSVDSEVVAMPDRGQWVRVTGRFDHPAAAECTFGEDPIRSKLQCRAQFVVDSAEVVPAP